MRSTGALVTEAENVTMDEAYARVGTQLNAKWTIDALLGSGGMATVYAASHRNGSRAALKVLHAELARDSAIRERFLREGKIANRIDHPSVVQIMDDDVSDQGEAFLVMELLEGETLESRIRHKGGKLPIEEIFRIFDPVLDLLSRAHDAQIIHRDVKPENIFVTKTGAIKLLDFGVARFREQQVAAGATRQGTALGTPSFMAPEQALGLGDLVDGRADLFSVGACIYTALSGARLHQGRGENEAFVLAATQAAPSVANVAPELPVEIVAFIDRALAYERNTRFSDASAMRAEMRALLEALESGRLTSNTKRAAGLVVKGDQMDGDEGATSVEAKAYVAKRMKNVWKLLGMFVASTRQYGWNHPESARHLQTAFAEAVETLASHPDAVRWEVTPYAFLYEGTPIWEPDRAPFDRMPFQLFADGLRRVQLKPGLTEQELRDLVAVLMRDASKQGEDDAITSLWDRHFEHVAYLAIDSFAEGDAEDRDAFEKECANLAGQALELARIDKDWDERSLEAKAGQVNLVASLKQAAESAAALAVDPATRAALAAQLTQSTDRLTERYVESFAQGYLDAQRAGDVEILMAALREWTADQITLQNYPLAFGMFNAIAETLSVLEPANAQAHQKQVARAMFPTSSLGAIVKKIASEPKNRESMPDSKLDETLATGVERVLDLLGDDSLFSVACSNLDNANGTPLGRVLFAYLKKWAAGNEATLGNMLGSSTIETSVALVQMLAELGTPASASAMHQGLRSPQVPVRVETLKMLPAGSPDALSEDLLFLLEDSELAVREETLRVIAKLKAKAVGPALVRFIDSPAFHTRSIEERRAWLETLAILNPARAESLASEILTSWKMFPKSDQEQTRVAAAEALAQFGSRHVLEAVQAAAKKRWWNTPPVREAAERALQAITERGARSSGSRTSILPERER